MYEEQNETRVAIIQENGGDDLHLSALRIEAARREGKLVEVFSEDSVEKKNSWKALLLIISAMSGNLLQLIHKFQTALDGWESLTQRLAGKAIISN